MTDVSYPLKLTTQIPFAFLLIKPTWGKSTSIIPLPCYKHSKLNLKKASYSYTMKIQNLSRKFIKPSVPTPHHFRTMKISFLDQLAPSAYPPILFHYTSNEGNGCSRAEKLESQRNRLETSLSDTLTLFYPLAGRFIEDNLSIDCNDQGVEYLEAQVDSQLTEILQGEPDAEMLTHFLPFVAESDTSPLVLIQVNLFDCGGIVIGVRASHRIADGFTFSTFINGWAKASRAGINEVTRPSFDTAAFLPEYLSWVKPVPFQRGGAKYVTKRFVFNGATILSLKDKAKAGVGDGSGATRLEVLMALIWRALINVTQAKNGLLRPSLLTLPINLRGKMFPIIPENCCGNLYRICNIRFMADESKMELHDFVSLLRNGKKKAMAECEKTVHGDDGFKMVIDSFKEFHEETYKDGVDVCKFTSMCRFPLYEVDFGWGKPARVSSMSLPIDLVFLMDTKSGDGIEAWVSMVEESMLHFQQDPNIVAYIS